MYQTSLDAVSVCHVTAALPPNGALPDAADCPNSPGPGLPGAPNAGNSPAEAAGADAAATVWPNKAGVTAPLAEVGAAAAACG